MLTRENKARLIIILIVVVVSMSLITITYIIYLNGKNDDNSKVIENSAETIQENNFAPTFVNLPPTKIMAGENYYYDIKITDDDTQFEELKLQLDEGPGWLQLNGYVLNGVPTVQDIGNAKVTLTLSDGTNVVYKTFYITVTEYDNGQNTL